MSAASESRHDFKAGSADSVDQLTQRNIEAVRELEEAAKEERTRSDRVAEAIANFCGSMTFVWVHVVWFGIWILINVIPRLPHIVVSLEAIFLSTFILISQNHDTKISERRNHLDLQINLLSEQENTQMLTMLRAIAEKVGANLSRDDQVRAMSEETKPQQVVKQIKEREED
jgi:uncharacterized membrane protein